jgi:hypothetical protein
MLDGPPAAKTISAETLPEAVISALIEQRSG